jgi:hypothetical protein
MYTIHSLLVLAQAMRERVAKVKLLFLLTYEERFFINNRKTTFYCNFSKVGITISFTVKTIFSKN